MPRTVSDFFRLQSRSARARALLATLALALLASVWVAFATPASIDLASASSVGRGDGALYARIVDRLESGEAYYAVVAEELREGGYALRPAVNFRLPTLATALAATPGEMAERIALGALALATLLAWLARLKEAGGSPVALALAGVGLFSGVGLAFTEAALVWHEVWAGLLLALGLALHRADRWPPAAAVILAACMIRELALLAPVMLLAYALARRRWAEAAGWAGVILIFASVFLLHLQAVLALTSAQDPANSWMRWGGWGFVLSTLRWNVFLMDAPLWLPALLAPFALVGLIRQAHAGYRERSDLSWSLRAKPQAEAQNPV